jgi:osmotically-inducible protein OsmY
MAEDALDSVSGIKDVHNQLRVQQSQGRANQDQVIGQTQMDDGQGSTASSRGPNRNQPRRAETAEAGASNS